MSNNKKDTDWRRFRCPDPLFDDFEKKVKQDKEMKSVSDALRKLVEGYVMEEENDYMAVKPGWVPFKDLYEDFGIDKSNANKLLKKLDPEDKEIILRIWFVRESAAVKLFKRNLTL
jgi:hypothetical protein